MPRRGAERGRSGSGARKRTARPRRRASDAPAPRRRGEPAAAVKPFPIVAIGASAGGLGSLRKFFATVPTGTAIGFVVAQHLDPRQVSMLAELIQRDSPLPVQEVTESQTVEAGRVYVLGPGRGASINGDRLVIGGVNKVDAHAAIDALFRSLAQARGERGACIVLSGTGTSGAVGLKAIKEAGGIALVEAPHSAEYDGMPRAAIATGLADRVAPAGELAAILIGYFEKDGWAGRGRRARGRREADLERRLPEVLSLLRLRTGHDFGQYKTSTILRRIQRRMNVTQNTGLDDYLDTLKRDTVEADRLFRDLLIGVTHFFRDMPAFRALQRRVLAKLVAGRDPEDPIRVWIPGAATGEEGYTIAILLHELLGKLERPPKAQLFITDLDPDAIEFARAGFYPQAISKDISQQRLRRYFVRQDSGFRVHAEIREMCVFSVHNLISDPPFSKLDLISCRNVLIYFNTELQRRVLPILHYATKPGGFLFLGPSENVADANLFAPLDKKYRIFRRRDVPFDASLELPLPVPRVHGARPVLQARGPNALDFARIAERVFLDQFATPFVLVNREGDILHVSGRTGRYLELPPGQVRASILDMAKRGLRMDLRAALHQAIQKKKEVVQENVVVEGDGGAHRRIDLVVRPLTEFPSSDPCYMVVFRDSPAGQGTEPAKGSPAAAVENDAFRQLEAELGATKERLQTSVEEFETSNEELKSANEELLSMNEELHSANEELDTSKEELQSVNEELQTVNAELNSKVQQLGDAHSSVNNLLQSTRIATVFLDMDLKIRYFTPSVAEIFNLIDGDIGRPITHFSGRLDVKAVERDARAVLRTLMPVEREVALDGRGDARTFILRILPYRTVKNVIDGVVATFVDITEHKRTELERARLDAMIEASPDAIFGLSPDGKILAWNRGAEGMFGYRPQDAVGRSAAGFIFEEKELRPILQVAKQGTIVHDREMKGMRRRGNPVPLSVTASPAKADRGKITAVSIVARDITARKLMEERQAVLMRELNHRVKNSLATAQSMLRLSHRDGMSLPDFIKVFGDPPCSRSPTAMSC
jgi:two-component system CheB/CheR fusion protein